MNVGKRVMVLMLSVLMTFSMFPVSVLAGEEPAPEAAPKATEAQEPAKETAPKPKTEAPEKPAKEEVTPEPEAPAETPSAEESSKDEEPAEAEKGDSSDTPAAEQNEDGTPAEDAEEAEAEKEEIKYPAQTLRVTASDGAVITVKAPEGAFPEGSYVKAKPVSEKAVLALVDGAVEAAAYDITVYNADGKEVQPKGDVKVSMANTGLSDADAVYYVNDAMTKASLVTKSIENAGDSFTTDHFTIYVVIDQGGSPSGDQATKTLVVKTGQTGKLSGNTPDGYRITSENFYFGNDISSRYMTIEKTDNGEFKWTATNPTPTSGAGSEGAWVMHEYTVHEDQQDHVNTESMMFIVKNAISKFELSTVGGRSTTIMTGDHTLDITATIEPENYDIQWSVDDESILTIKQDGIRTVLVDPQSAGTTTIRATADGQEATIDITVKQQLGISIVGKDKVYGEDDPAFTTKVNPATPCPDELKAEIESYLVRNEGENVGKYTIGIGDKDKLQAWIDDNYPQYYVHMDITGQFQIYERHIAAKNYFDYGTLQNVAYNGKEQKQKPTYIKYTKYLGTDHEEVETLKENTDYTLSYSDDVTNIGTVTVTVTGKGNFKETKTLTYQITDPELQLGRSEGGKVAVVAKDLNGKEVANDNDVDTAGENYTMPYGSTATLTATAAEGYKFIGWYGGIIGDTGKVTGYDENDKWATSDSETQLSLPVVDNTPIYALFEKQLKVTLIGSAIDKDSVGEPLEVYASPNTAMIDWDESVKAEIEEYFGKSGYSLHLGRPYVMSKPMSNFSNWEDVEAEDGKYYGEALTEDTTFYVALEKPVNSIELTVKKPVCGTEVASEKGSFIPAQSNAPVLTVDSEGARLPDIDEGVPSAVWVKTDEDGRPTEIFEGTIKGGNKYGVVSFVVPKFGYYLNNPKVKINGADSGSEIIMTGATGGQLAFSVTAEHEWGDWTETRKPTTAKAGEEKRVCKHCSAEETRPIDMIAEYTITYDLNGGTLNGKKGKVSFTVEAGTVITLPKPKRNGYTFDYWKGSKYEAGDEYTVNGDHTFTAQWTGSGKGVDTGDAAGLAVWLMLGIAAEVGIVYMGRRRRREN